MTTRNPSRPPDLLVVALFSLSAALLASILILVRGPDLPLHLLILPVLVAALFYPRWVYLTMGAAAILFSAAVVSALHRSPDSSLKTIGAVGLTVLATCELIQRLTQGRLLAEARLREAMERMGALVGAAPVAIVALGRDGKVESWNPAAERLFGWSESQTLGRPLPIIAEGYRDPVSEVVSKARLGATVTNVEARVRTREGRLVVVGLSAAPLSGPANGVGGVLLTAADLTDRSQAEDAARKLIREQAARAEAERASAGKEVFLATLGHELRSPLAAIASAAAVLERAGIESPVARRQTAVIRRQIEQVDRLLEDLRDVTRIGRGKLELRRSTLDLREPLRQAAETARPLLESRRHAFALDLPAVPVPVDGDPARLEQVFVNLLNNAAKYTDPGGRVELSLVWDNDVATVRIRDNGIGISPDLLPRVFDLFAQADAGDRAQGGLGLGLALVRSLVELHGGSVEVESEGEGRGSVFAVRLPVRDPNREGEVDEEGEEEETRRAAAEPPGE